MEKKYIKFVKKFMDKLNLYPKNGIGYVAVSGGLDSMALMYILDKIVKNHESPLKKIIVIHFNHGTRKDNSNEEKLVSKFCTTFDIEFLIKPLNLDLNISNFENTARSKRQKYFKDLIDKDSCLYMAHHITDSFEWYLLNNFKTSGLKSSLGIPVVNGNVLRPFMCITRCQLEKFVAGVDIGFLEDKSNKNIRFERNFIRHMIIENIENRFPKFLKHYVNRANQLAIRLNQSLLIDQCEVDQIKNDYGVIIIDKSFNSNFFGREEQIKGILKQLSLNGRGVWSEQINKVILATKTNSWGPMSFSGNLMAIPIFSAIYFYKKSNEFIFDQIDNFLLKYLNTLEASDIPRRGFSSFQNDFKDNLIHFPYIIISMDKTINKLCPSIKRTDGILIPKSIQFAKQNFIWIQFAPKFLSIWKKNKNICYEIEIFNAAAA